MRRINNLGTYILSCSFENKNFEKKFDKKSFVVLFGVMSLLVIKIIIIIMIMFKNTLYHCIMWLGLYGCY